MNRPLLVAALLAAFTAAVHAFAGGQDVAAPLLASTLAEVPKRTLHAVWHMASVVLALSAPALFVGSLPRHAAAARYLVLFVSALWCAFAAVFLIVVAVQPDGGWLFRLPQWSLLLPVGALGFWGASRTARSGNPAAAPVPADSEIRRRLSGAQFHDCYRLPLPAGQRSALDLYLAVAKRTPGWVNRLMALRNTLVALAGLKNIGHIGAVDASKAGSAYRVGDRVGIFSVLYLADDEVILGDSDKHLDVQVSVHRIFGKDSGAITVTTVVHVKNALGRIYMLFVVPVHKLIVPAMLRRLRDHGLKDDRGL